MLLHSHWLSYWCQTIVPPKQTKYSYLTKCQYKFYLPVSISHKWTQWTNLWDIDLSRRRLKSFIHKLSGHEIFCTIFIYNYYGHQWNTGQPQPQKFISLDWSRHDSLHIVKDKNGIFTGYQIFVTGQEKPWYFNGVQCRYNAAMHDSMKEPAGTILLNFPFFLVFTVTFWDTV